MLLFNLFNYLINLVNSVFGLAFELKTEIIMSSIDVQKIGKTSKYYGPPKGSRRYQNRTDENGVNRATIYLESDQHPVYRPRWNADRGILI